LTPGLPSTNSTGWGAPARDWLDGFLADLVYLAYSAVYLSYVATDRDMLIVFQSPIYDGVMKTLAGVVL
jgi:hypothetical protein